MVNKFYVESSSFVSSFAVVVEEELFLLLFLFASSHLSLQRSPEDEMKEGGKAL